MAGRCDPMPPRQLPSLHRWTRGLCMLCFLLLSAPQASPGASLGASQPPSAALKLGYVLPQKKMRLLPPLLDAFRKRGAEASLVQIDLESEERADVDVLLTHCGYLFGAERGGFWSAGQLARLEAMDHGSAPVIDSLEGQRIMADRQRFLGELRSHVSRESGVPCACGQTWRVMVPVSVSVPGPGAEVCSDGPPAEPAGAPTGAESSQCVAEVVEAAMRDGGLGFPVLCKPLHDDGRASSHDLAVAWGAEGAAAALGGRGGVLQEFVEHEEMVYKVYVAGGSAAVVHRPSVPNDLGRSDGVARFSRASSDGVARRMQESDPLSFKRTVLDAPVLPEAVVQAAARLVSESTKGAELFGFDLLRRKGTHDCYIVDVNHFPGFHGMPAFPDALAHLVLQKCRGEREELASRVLQGASGGPVTCFLDEGARQRIGLRQVPQTDSWEDTEDTGGGGAGADRERAGRAETQEHREEEA